MHFSWITAQSCESISNKCQRVCARLKCESCVNVSIHMKRNETERSPLFQSVRSSPEEFTPSSDSTTRNPWTPSHHFAARSTSLSSRPVSLWTGISSLSSRWDLTSRDPSSALLSTTNGTSLPICTTVTEVIHCRHHLCCHDSCKLIIPLKCLRLKRSALRNASFAYKVSIVPSWLEMVAKYPNCMCRSTADGNLGPLGTTCHT